MEIVILNHSPEKQTEETNHAKSESFRTYQRRYRRCRKKFSLEPTDAKVERRG
jgi:hypothetical protein